VSDGGGLWAFAGLAALLTVLPGADMALVLRSVLTRGRSAGVVTSLGICSGLTVHALAAALGLSALLSTSATAFQVVKTAGAAYLVFLGVQTIREALRSNQGAPEGAGPLNGTPAPAATMDHRYGRSGLGRAFVSGMLTNILNPKVAVFYLTVLPQFIGPEDPLLARAFLLAGIHIAMGLVWLTAYVWTLARLGRFLTRPHVRRALGHLTGAVLVGLGLRLAWERR